MVNKIETPKSKEPERALEEELKDLNLKLPVLEVLAHASMYNAILDKYVESLELGKNRSTFIQGEMLKKIKDPELFTLPCRLGDSKPFDTLDDLVSCGRWDRIFLAAGEKTSVGDGAAFSISRRCHFQDRIFGLLEKTENVLGLADGTKSYPIGIVKNVEDPMYNIILKKKLARKEGRRGNFVIPCSTGIHKEDEHMPLILGTPFLTTARAEIKFHKGSMTLKAGKYKIRFVTTLEFPSKIEERIERDLNPMIPTNYVNRRVLEWEERIKICQENEIGFIKWRFKVFDDKNLIGHNFFFYELEKEGSTAKAEGVT
ncbi:zf-CCHC domain-containing protein [Tanacetum coccineum]